MFNTRKLGAFGAWAFIVVSASAETYTLDFEGSNYALGSTLTGQNGWVPNWENVQAGIIQEDATHGKVAKLARTLDSPPHYGAKLPHSSLPGGPQTAITRLEWSMMTLNGTRKSDLWGLGAHYAVRDEEITLGVNAADKVTFRNGWIGTVTTSFTAARGTWHDYAIDIDHEGQKAKLYFDGNFLGEWKTIGSPPGFYSSVVLYSDSLGSNDGALYDGIKITAGAAPVPEPATMAALGLGALALIRRKRST